MGLTPSPGNLSAERNQHIPWLKSLVNRGVFGGPSYYCYALSSTKLEIRAK
jgi:hypothetical protein